VAGGDATDASASPLTCGPSGCHAHIGFGDDIRSRWNDRRVADGTIAELVGCDALDGFEPDEDTIRQVEEQLDAEDKERVAAYVRAGYDEWTAWTLITREQEIDGLTYMIDISAELAEEGTTEPERSSMLASAARRRAERLELRREVRRLLRAQVETPTGRCGTHRRAPRARQHRSRRRRVARRSRSPGRLDDPPEPDLARFDRVRARRRRVFDCVSVGMAERSSTPS
jgi:hypothetical protein